MTDTLLYPVLRLPSGQAYIAQDSYPLYSDSDLTVTCEECYYSITAPVSMSLEWGEGYGDFGSSATAGINAQTNIDIKAVFQGSYRNSFSKLLLDSTPVTGIVSYSKHYIMA